MNRSSRTLVFCSLIGIGLFSLLNALPSSVGTEGVETINKLRAEDWLRNQIGYVVGEKSTPSGERQGLSKNPPSPNHESGQPKAENRASESPTAGLKAAESVAPQTEHLEPKTATDPDLWNFGIGHSPLVPLSPLRPIFTEILLTSLAVEEEGAELVGMTVQMDLPELGLTGEAILTDIRSAPAIEPPVDHLDTRQVVTATFHHSSGDVIDLVVADSRSTLPGLPGRTCAAGEPQCRAVVPTAQSRNQGVNDWDNRSTEVAASREVLSGREDQQEAASDSPLSAFGSPLSPACEVGDSNHEPAESEETIGTTSNHPFWSVDRQEFVQAGSLEIGERLQTLSGDVKVVQQKLPRPGPQPVFNLEVHNEHVYFVGQDGVLVHNAGPNGLYSGTGAFGKDPGPDSGITTALEPRSRNSQVAAFEDGAPGIASDLATQKKVVPALRFVNPNPRGRNVVRFDGRIGNELIDRKLNVTTISKQLRDLRRMSEAVSQNPSVTAVIEVQSDSVRRAAIRALEKAGVSNIRVRIATQ